ncbi:hypothetical protein AX16_003093 [Volvariella volvacea WC 439]|nr:hypothetical protein AX16_003093 [Volvariella volvacea WC 439]
MPAIQFKNLDDLSDAIDEVNVLKGNDREWTEESEFDKEKDKSQFRNYEQACERVKTFYKDQHRNQTYEYNLWARRVYETRPKWRMSVWQAMELLNTLVDESDPDTNLSQIEHLLQTAEAIRRDGKPEWMQVAGLVHDLGKLLQFTQPSPQWAIVGDTFVVGCAWSDKIIYPNTFDQNPDTYNPLFSSKYGVYHPNCGLENVMISWGHDEYMYEIAKNQSTLPDEALAMIRYHSFYPWHREGTYRHLMNKDDELALKAVKAFNPYDLYSKSDEPCDIERLRPYYEELIAKYFPPVVEW